MEKELRDHWGFEKDDPIKVLENGLLRDYGKYGATLYYFDYCSAQIDGCKTLEGLKDSYELGGSKQVDYGYDNRWDEEEERTLLTGLIFFTPLWGESKKITDVKEFIKYRCKAMKIKEAFFKVRWIKKSKFEVENIETRELVKDKHWDRFEHDDKHDYYHFKEGKITELGFDKDLPRIGLLNGQDMSVSYAKAKHQGLKEWECDGKIWNEEKYWKWRN